MQIWSNPQANMSGRAYTMKEMKGIVDYLVEKKCYSEYRGRKMWVDYASSDRTSRTWQSLKETFLKRILPDIHNPYYKLQLDEIRSFRIGEDVLRKPRNKLEFQTTSEDSTNAQDNPTTSQNKSNKASKEPGEKIQATSNRESVETIILGSDEPAPTKPVETPTKMSLRDHIQHSDEPLVPIIRDILHDFSDSDEEKTGSQDNLKDKLCSKSKGTNNEEKKKSPSKNYLSLKKKENKSDTIATKENSDKRIVTRNRNQTISSRNDDVTVSNQDISADQSTPNASNSMPDSILPNNPEELKHKNSTKNSNETVEQPNPKKKSADSSTLDKVVKVTRKGIKDLLSSSVSPLADLTKNHTGSAKKKAPSTPQKNEPNNAVVVPTVVVNDSEKLNTEENKMTNTSSQQSTNPCLQSVSLFAEMFLEVNSDTDINTNSKNSSHSQDKSDISPTILNSVLTKDKKVVSKDVVVLESHSESASDGNTQPAKQEPQRATKTQSRGNSNFINNLFGSSNGGVNRKHKRSSSHRNIVNRHYVQSSGSSGWTSESDSDCYVSPPRSRRRLARKYLKPQSSRILSLEEDGGLFVVCGKKVFPLVKDGKSSGNHLTYLPERDSDEEKDSYWQLKYVEERKKTSELTKLLQNIKHGEMNQPRSRQSVAVDSPILQTKPSKNQKCIVIDDNNSDPEEEVKEQSLAIPSAPKEIVEEKTVKIKFAKDNEEVQLEGHWRSLHPILGDVMQMFKQHEPAARAPCLADSIGAEDAHKKVNALEAEIFKEIEERNVKERLQSNEDTENNVTESRKRGGPSNAPAARASKRLRGSAGSVTSAGSTASVASIATLSSGSDALELDSKRTRRSRSTKLSGDNFTTSKDVTSTLPKRKSNTKLKTSDETPKVKRGKSTTSALQGSNSAKKDSNMNDTASQVKTSTEGLAKNADTSPRQLRTSRKSATNELKEIGVASVQENNASLNENEVPLHESEAAIDEDDSQILYKIPTPVPQKKPVGRSKTHRKQ